jgi:Cytochrome P450
MTIQALLAIFSIVYLQGMVPRSERKRLLLRMSLPLPTSVVQTQCVPFPSLHTSNSDVLQTIGTATGLILALAMYPDAQRRAQEEIDSVIGPNRLPDWDDYERLPYLQAVVKEVVRMWPVAPLGTYSSVYLNPISLTLLSCTPCYK